MKKYKIIYCDPPWEFTTWSDKAQRSAKRHYRTTPLSELKRFDVNALAEQDAVLLMWATFPNLLWAIELGSSWGFTYKTIAFTWIKKNKKSSSLFIGMGYYTRSNAEIVLLFTKGKPLERKSRSVEQVLISKIGEHSQKPPEVRERIVKLFGDVSRVELFARSREGFFPNYEYEGWDVFGNEVIDSITL